MVEPWLRKPVISVRLRYVSTKTDNAFCSAVEQAVGKPLVAGSNPVCANRKSIIRVEMSKVSFIYGAACSKEATWPCKPGGWIRFPPVPRKLCWVSSNGKSVCSEGQKILGSIPSLVICRSSKDGLCNGLKIRGFPIVTGGRHE